LPKLRYDDSGNLEGAGGWGGGPLAVVRTEAFNGDLFLTLFEPSFNPGVDDKWSTNSNWTGSFAPNGVEHDAAFNSGGLVNLDLDVTLGTLKFNGLFGGFMITSPTMNKITMNAGAGTARMDVLSYSNVVEPKLVLASDTRINTDLADVTFMGELDNSAGKTITVAGIGTVTFTAQTHAPGSIMAVDSGNVVFQADAGGVAAAHNLRLFTNGNVTFNSSQHLAELGVNAGGRATLAARNSPPKVLYTNALSIAYDVVNSLYTGTLDLNDNDLVVNYGTNPSEFANVQQAVFAGYSASVDPSKTGIISTTSQNNAGVTILALFDNAMIGVGDWPAGSGNTVPANAVIGKYTYFGDVSFDGQVTGDDYAIIDANLGTVPDPGVAWLAGDANLDGQVTGDDYAVIDANLGLGNGMPLSPQALSSGGGAAVPEPASAGVLCAAAAGAILRRRRRQN